MDNVDIKDFWLASGVNDNDYVVLSLNAGTSARIPVSTLRDAIGAAIKPSIVDGEWHIGGVATGVEAGGETPVFRWTEQGIEYKYETDGDDSWQLLVPRDEIVLDFDSLTAEQRDSLRLKFSDLTDAEIAELQQPANEMIAELEKTNESVQSAENARVKEFEDLKNASEAATNKANDIANHPTYVGEDNYVYRWDNDANVYVKTDVYVKGEQGETPSFETGSVTTLEPNQSAMGTVEYVRTESDGTPVYKINLSVPRGQKGENGSGSGNVLVDTTKIVANKKYIFQSVKDNDAEGVFVEFDGTLMYADGNKSLFFYTNNANRMIISPSGNVGIGTTTPAYTLDVNGNIRASSITNQVFTGVSTYTSGVVRATQVLSPTLTSSFGIGHIFGKELSNKNCGNIVFNWESDQSDNNRVSIGLYSVDNLLNILGNGYVGIGTTSPSYMLDVAGKANATTLYEDGKSLSSKYLSTTGTAAKATCDDNGNNIVDTYVTKTELGTMEMVTGVKMNGTTKSPSDGVVDLGDVLTEEPEIAIIEHGTGDTTFTLTPNVMHKWGTVSSLNLSLGSSDSEVMNFYMATFTSGSTATTLTVPESVVWDSEVSIEANKTYELSIVDNRGIIVGF